MPVREDLLGQLAELALRQRRAVVRPLQLGRERLAARAERLPAPAALLSPHVQRLDDLSERLRRGLTDRTQLARGELSRVAAGMSPPLLRARAEQAKGRLDGLGRVLQSLNPNAVLVRGYARISARDGRTLIDRAAAAGEAALTIHFRDGALDVAPAGPMAGTAAAPARAPAKPKAAPPADPGAQGKLL